MVERFRLGATSYVYPADVLTNVQRLVGRVADIEIVLFQSEDHGDNFPDSRTIDFLARAGAEHDLTYTVHLPLDLELAGESPKIDSAVSAITKTAGLSPQGYIVHLDTNPACKAPSWDQWLKNSLRSLDKLFTATGSGHLLCVENLESQQPGMLDPLLERMPVGLCIDLGHLWKQGLDPIPIMDRWLPRTRVIHIHGVNETDHQSLGVMKRERLDPVTAILSKHFTGVVTLEVFSENHLEESLVAYKESLRRNGRPEFDDHLGA